jgi:hypothetical protein
MMLCFMAGRRWLSAGQVDEAELAKLREMRKTRVRLDCPSNDASLSPSPLLPLSVLPLPPLPFSFPPFPYISLEGLCLLFIYLF